MEHKVVSILAMKVNMEAISTIESRCLSTKTERLYLQPFCLKSLTIYPLASILSSELSASAVVCSSTCIRL